MPVVDSTINCDALKTRLSALSATVTTLQRQHYQRQFEECWAKSGGAEGLSSSGDSFYKNNYTNNTRGGISSNRTNRRQGNAAASSSSSSAKKQRDTAAALSPSLSTAAIPRRRPSVIHDLHLVGVCADHETDDSSCDEALTVERVCTRQMITKLKTDEAREAATNKETANSVTSVGNAAIAAGLTVTSGQMNHLAKVVARRSINLSEKFQHRRNDLEARSRRKVQSILERKKTKRHIETGLYSALHTPPVFQKRRAHQKADSSATAAAVAANNFSASSLPDATTFKIADLATIRAEERLAANTTPLQQQLLTAIDRYQNRMRHLKALRRQEDYSHMNAAEKATAELASVMKKRREFHRVRGAGAANFDGEMEDE